MVPASYEEENNIRTNIGGGGSSLAHLYNKIEDNANDKNVRKKGLSWY